MPTSDTTSRPDGVGRHQDHRRTLVHGYVGVGDDHHDQERREAVVGGEPLLAADDPFVAVAMRLAGELAGIGPGLGLGHGVGRGDLPVEQRLQVRRLLLVGAVVGQDLGVSGVRGLAAEHRGGERAAAQDLVHQGQLHLAVPLAAEVGPDVAGPQIPILHLLLEGRDETPELLVALVEGRDPAAEVQIEGFDLVPDERRRSSRADPGTRARR